MPANFASLSRGSRSIISSISPLVLNGVPRCAQRDRSSSSAGVAVSKPATAGSQDPSRTLQSGPRRLRTRSRSTWAPAIRRACAARPRLGQGLLSCAQLPGQRIPARGPTVLRRSNQDATRFARNEPFLAQSLVRKFTFNLARLARCWRSVVKAATSVTSPVWTSGGRLEQRAPCGQLKDPYAICRTLQVDLRVTCVWACYSLVRWSGGHFCSFRGSTVCDTVDHGLPITNSDFNSAGFVRRVKEAREAMGWTQAVMADLLEIPLERYKKYEHRLLLPHYLVAKFCELTGCDIYLFDDRRTPTAAISIRQCLSDRRRR